MSCTIRLFFCLYKNEYLLIVTASIPASILTSVLAVTLTLNGIANQIPYYSTVFSQTEYEFLIGSTYVIVIPTVLDDGDDILLDVNPLPAFMSKVNPSDGVFQLSVNAIFLNEESVHDITLRIYDDLGGVGDVQQIKIKIVVPPPVIITSNYLISNQGPPIFIESLQTIYIYPGVPSNFTLPAIIDPDDDNFTISLQLGELTSFTTFAINTLSFNPLPDSTYKDTYKAIIKLTDHNIKPQSSKYTLLVRLMGLTSNQTLHPPHQNATNITFSLRKPTRDGSVRLYINSKQSLYLSNQIARQLNESDFALSLNGQSTVNFTFEEDKDSIQFGYVTVYMRFEGIISLYDDPLDWIEIRAENDVIMGIEGKQYVIQKKSGANVEVPNQYSIEGVRLIQRMQEVANVMQIAMIPGSILINIFLQVVLQVIYFVGKWP